MSFTAALGAAAVAVPTAAFLAPVAIIQLARKEAFNVLIEPGNGVMVVKGEEFDRFEMSTPFYHFNRPDAHYYNPLLFPWQVLENGTLPRQYFDLRSQWEQENGIFPLGWPGKKKIHAEWFEWKEEREGRIVSRREKTKIFKINRFPYVVEQTGIMTQDKLLVKLTYVLGLRIINPYLALIATDDWLVQVLALAKQQARNWAASFAFTDLLCQTDGVGAEMIGREDFLKKMQELNKALELLGVELESADLILPEPDGPQALEYLTALNAPFQAEQAAKVAVIKAAAEAEATLKNGLAQAEVNEALARALAAGENARYKAANDYPQGAAIVNGVFAGAFTTSVNKLIDAVATKIGG